MLGRGEHGRRSNGQKEVMRAAPSLTRPPLVTSHMAPATVEASMVNLSPFCSFLFLAGGVVVGVVLARGAIPVQVCAVLAILSMRRVGRDSVRAKCPIGVGRVPRKAGHPPPVGRGRGARNQVPQTRSRTTVRAG